MKATDRVTADLSEYPDLVVIYLGMRVNTWAGIRTILGFGGAISGAVAARPEGLLLHERIIYSLRNIGMRQYWRDFEALEKWARSEPHRLWWQSFLRDTGGTGFWHEAYFKRGGMEAVYVDLRERVGFLGFAPAIPAQGTMFSARRRAGVSGEAKEPPPIREDEFYQKPGR